MSEQLPSNEEVSDLVDCLQRLKQAAAEDNWCEFSGYSSRLVWNEIERLRAALEQIITDCKGSNNIARDALRLGVETTALLEPKMHKDAAGTLGYSTGAGAPVVRPDEYWQCACGYMNQSKIRGSICGGCRNERVHTQGCSSSITHGFPVDKIC